MSGHTQKNKGVGIMGENKLSVVEALRSSWGRGVKPEAIGAHLRDANLWNANLRNADFRGANLQGAHLEGANLRGANLEGANLEGANLWNANLQCANLRNADFRGANLRGANLEGATFRDANLEGATFRDANLWNAHLEGANLRGADLECADLQGANLWPGFQHHGLPSGSVLMIPTVVGWHLTVGCWSGTREQLRELISQDDGWPSAKGAEVERRRPGLLAMLALADAHAEYYADELQAVVEKWGDKNE